MFKRDGEQSVKRERQLVSMLEAVERDIAVFQLEKQAKLNKLLALVPIKLHQILYFSACACTVSSHTLLTLTTLDSKLPPASPHGASPHLQHTGHRCSQSNHC